MRNNREDALIIPVELPIISSDEVKRGAANLIAVAKLNFAWLSEVILESFDRISLRVLVWYPSHSTAEIPFYRTNQLIWARAKRFFWNCSLQQSLVRMQLMCYVWLWFDALIKLSLDIGGSRYALLVTESETFFVHTMPSTKSMFQADMSTPLNIHINMAQPGLMSMTVA